MIPLGLPAVGTGNSVITPLVVILPILLKSSVNHRLPSGPAVMNCGKPLGTGYSVIVRPWGCAPAAGPMVALLTTEPDGGWVKRSARQPIPSSTGATASRPRCTIPFMGISFGTSGRIAGTERALRLRRGSPTADYAAAQVLYISLGVELVPVSNGLL